MKYTSSILSLFSRMKGNLIKLKIDPYIIYFCLVFILCLSAFLHDLFYGISMPHSFKFTPEYLEFMNILPYNIELGLFNAIWKLFAYGIFGLLGLHLSSKIGFKNILNNEIRQIKNIKIIIFISLFIGVYFIGCNELFRILEYRSANLPEGILISISEGIGDQILQMSIISLFLWIFSIKIKSKKILSILFWVVAILCAMLFTIEHIFQTRAVWVGYGWVRISIGGVGIGWFDDKILVAIGLYAPLSLVCSYFFKKYGLLSAILIQTVSDFIWSVLYGTIWLSFYYTNLYKY